MFHSMKRKAPEPELVPSGAPPMRIGYARVSTEEQDVDHQVRQLESAKCDVIYKDTVSGRSKKRPVLDRILRDLRPEDTLVVTQLDRVCRNARQFYEIMDSIYKDKATFESLKERFTFTESLGRFVMGVLALVAEFEANLISDRTKSGIAAARARGAQIGQPVKFTDEVRAKALKMWKARGRDRKWKYTTVQIAEALGVSVSTINNRMPGGRAGNRRRK